MASSFTLSPPLAFFANRAIIGAKNDLARIRRFSTNLSPDRAQKGETILVNKYEISAGTAFHVTDNNYGKVNGEVTPVEVKITEHYKKTYGLTDRDFLTLETGELARCADAAGVSLGMSIQNVVAAALKTATGTDGATPAIPAAGLTTRAEANAIRKLAIDKKIGVRNTNLVLDGIPFTDLISLFDSSVIGNSSPIQEGRIDRLQGYNSVEEFQGFAGDGAIVGALVPVDNLVIAGRTIEFVPGQNHGSAEYGTVTDPESGLVIGIYKFYDYETRTWKITAEALFGAKTVTPEKTILLHQAASQP